MAYAEPFAITSARRKKAAETWPVLSSTDAGDAIQVDNWGSQQGQPVSEFTMAATRIGAAAAQEPDDQPDAAPNVIPWTSVAKGQSFDYFNPQQVTNAPTGAGEGAPSAGLGQTLGTIGGGIASFLGGDVPPALQPDSRASLREQMAGSREVIEGAIMNANLPAGVKSAYPALGAFDQFVTPAELPRPQFGRTAESDALFTAGPNGEVVGPTGNVAEMRLGREPVMGEDVNAGLRRTAYGRAQQDALAAEEQAAFRDAGERAISGAVPDGGTPPLGGGAAERPQFTIEDLNAVIAEKKAAGLTPEQILADPQVQAYQREVFKLDAPTDFNAPENLGGGAEVPQAGIDTLVQRAGSRQQITDALANARAQERPHIEYGDARDPSRIVEGSYRVTDDPRRAQFISPNGQMVEGLAGADHEHFDTAVNMLGMKNGVDDFSAAIREVQDAGWVRFKRSGDGLEVDVRGSLTPAQMRSIRRQLPEGGSIYYDTPNGGGQADTWAEFQRAVRDLDEPAMRGAYDKPALDSVIARNADTLPEPNRTQPPHGYLERFRQPPAGGADVPSQPGMTPRFEGMEPEAPAPTRMDQARMIAQEAATFPMSAASTYDASAPGRQLAPFLYGHPTRIIPILKAQFGGMKTRTFEEAQQALANKPYAHLRDIAKVEMAELGTNLSKREEQIASVFAEKVLPKSKNFNQGYTLAINEARDWLFKSMLDQVDPSLLTEAGLREGGIKELERIGGLVNASTGRGSDLGGILKQNKVLGIPAFWAPRMLVGRAQLVTSMASPSPIVRKEAARQLASFVAVNTALLTIAAKSGVASVELDPRSADFGQFNIAGHRYDPWAGYRPLVNLVARIGYGLADKPNMKTVDSPTADGSLYTKGNMAVINRFLRTKLSPIAGEAVSQSFDKDLSGKKPSESIGGRAGHATYNLAAPSLFLKSLIEEMASTVPQGFARGGVPGALAAGATSTIANVPYFLGASGGYYDDAPTGSGSGSNSRPVRPTRPTRTTRPTRPSR